MGMDAHRKRGFSCIYAGLLTPHGDGCLRPDIPALAVNRLLTPHGDGCQVAWEPQVGDVLLS